MSEQDRKLESPMVDTRRADGVSPSRRRWVKGGVFAAPVLLTLPKGAALADASNTRCVSAPTNDAPGSPPGIDAAGYVSVVRDSYVLDKNSVNVTVVNVLTSPESESGEWHEINAWGNVYSKSGTDFIQTSGGTGTFTGSSPSTLNVIVQVDSNGNPTGTIGPGQGIRVITGSCWNSALPSSNLPQ